MSGIEIGLATLSIASPRLLLQSRVCVSCAISSDAPETIQLVSGVIVKPLRSAAIFCLLMVWACAASAAATVISAKGGVQMTSAQGYVESLAPGQRVEAGASIKTGPSGEISMRFDDGQMLALSSSTTYVINEYRFNPHKPEVSSFLSSLVKGGLRAVSGIIGETNKNNVKFKTGVATMGIRGTDFMLFSDNSQLYISVLEGAVPATNEGGEAVFDANTQPHGKVINSQTMAMIALPTDFPAATQAAFRVMQMLPLSDTIRHPNPQDPSCGDRR